MMGGMGQGYGGYGQNIGGYSSVPIVNSAVGGITPNSGVGQTGTYLGAGAAAAGGQGNQRMPHVIPNAFDNTILIEGTPQEYGQILGLLRQLDIPPRQVLIEAKIYEVDQI